MNMTPRAKFLIRLVPMAAFAPLLLMLTSGDPGWVSGWVFSAFSFAYTLASRTIIFQRRPDLIAERGRALKQSNVEPWDRVLVPMLGAVLPTAMILTAGLDRRLGWAPEFPAWIQAGAYVPMILGSLFALWAATTNAFFSAVVRIQTDRGQKVVTTGPYCFIRHPGYAGTLLYNLFVPFALGSVWTCLPVFLILVLTVVRTLLEDKTLMRKLAGYKSYARGTRRILIPGVW